MSDRKDVNVDFAFDSTGVLVNLESKTLEFKRDLSSPRSVLESLVAFANSAGGQVVIGVDDQRHVIGLTDPLADEIRLSNLIADSISPQLLPSVSILPLAGQSVLVVDVALSMRRPHYLKSLGPNGGTFVRLGSSDRQARPDVVDELRRSSLRQSFDRQPVPDSTVDDLDLAGLAVLLGRNVDDGVLRTLEFVTLDQGRLVPSVAGMLVAGRDHRRFFPSAFIQCARLRGPNRLAIVDQLDVASPLPTAVEEALSFLRKHAFLSAEFDQVRRKDVYSIPVGPLREIITNAVVHSSYAAEGIPIKVAFFDDHIRVDSPGGLVPGLTIDAMTRGVSMSRNQVIARAFKEFGFIESWGLGLPSVMSRLAEDGLPAPEFVENAAGLSVVIHIPQHGPQVSQDYTHDMHNPHDGTYDTQKSTHDLGTRTHDSPLDTHNTGLAPSGRERRAHADAVVRMLLGGALTRQELLDGLGLANIYQSFQRHVRPLIDAGLVEPTLPSKPKSKHQRYRLTPTGQRQAEAGPDDE